jgi:metal-responsive CopG/Arc/MetJ family transcriptional regulator
MVRTQIQLTKAQAAAVKRLSEERSVSMAETVRQAIEQLTEQSRHSSNQQRRTRALAVIGKFRSGDADLSTHHDKYFADGPQ